GAEWDLKDNTQLNEIALDVYNNNGGIAAVDHVAVGLLNIKKEEDYIDKDKNVKGLTNSEEENNGISDYMLYLLEDEYKNIGAQFKKEEDWSEFAVTDWRIVTGQNPQSGHAVAKEVLNIISKN